MRNISFALTTKQVRRREKTVTRRIGWAFLKPGTMLQPVVKVRGLKSGEHVEPIGGPIQVTAVHRERLDAITQADVYLEGFIGMDRAAFIDMFCQSHRPCDYDWMITRIEFRYVEEPHEH